MQCKFLIVLFFLPLNLFAQFSNWELGFSAGASSYLGDIGGRGKTGVAVGPTDIIFRSTRYSGGVHARVNAAYRFSFQFHLNYTLISGADSLVVLSGRFNRNLHFRNSIIDIGSRLEYHPIVINDFGSSRTFNHKLNMYVFAGLSIFRHNPQTKYKGSWIDLRPLNTEGKQNQYSSISTAIPIGGGIMISYKSSKERYIRNRIGIEFNYRVTFTDYLDDVSSSYLDANEITNPVTKDLFYRGWETRNEIDPNTRSYPKPGQIRGNPSNNDGYFTFLVTYSRILKGKYDFSKRRHGHLRNSRRKMRKAKF